MGGRLRLQIQPIARALVRELGFPRQDQDRIFVANLLTSIGKILLLEDGASKKSFWITTTYSLGMPIVM